MNQPVQSPAEASRLAIHPKAVEAPHSLVALDRRDMTVKGVREVLSFDESNIRLDTTGGILNIEGRDLRIHVLNTADGVVHATGLMTGVLYEDGTPADGDSTLRREKRPRRLFG